MDDKYKPRCPECGRSQGIGVEGVANLEWSNGGWRVRDFEPSTDDSAAGCPCGATFLLGQAYKESDGD